MIQNLAVRGCQVHDISQGERQRMHGFGLTIEELDAGAVRIALRGELDLAHAYTFDEELRRVEESRPSCVVLDLRELSFLDSCGLARLLAARRRARRAKHRLLIVRGPAAVQRLFALSAVDEAFEMVSEVPEALTTR
jgi:anti-anti-sigma factor